MNRYFERKKIEEVRNAKRANEPFPDYVLNEEETLLLHRDTLLKIMRNEDEAREEKQRLDAERKAQSAASAKKPKRPLPRLTAEVGGEDAALLVQGWARKKPGTFMHRLFDRRDVIKQFQKVMEVETGDTRTRAKAYFEILKKAGEYRALSSVPSDFREQLRILQEECPNFGEPISYVFRAMILAEAENKPPTFAKILLDGPPGIGKTFFAQRLAEVINSSLHIVHLESMQLSSDLIGNSKNWSNSAAGMLFNVLIDSKQADPAILLDEIDKVRSDDRFDVNGALLGLLEEGTASKFKDQCETWLELDASKVIYIATSNNADAIHPAVRSRLRRFSICTPSDSTAVIKNVYKHVQAEFPTATKNMCITDGAMERLLKLSPRKIREALRDAVGRAVEADRSTIVATDIEDTPAASRIGF